MDGKYILESESEEEEVQDADLDAIKSSITSDGWQLQDIDQVCRTFELFQSFNRYVVEKANICSVGPLMESPKE